MSNLYYPKLAMMNIKKNSKTYLPYLLTCICIIMMFYIMHSISINKGLEEIGGSAILKSILSFGTTVIAIFSAIFLFYTNSFLMKRRKKELGLYNVLGLDKRHIAKVLFFESLFISSIALLIGLIAGVILDKLMFLLLLKLLHFEVSLGFSFSLVSVLVSSILFLAIFLVILLSNLIQIKRLKTMELLKGEEHGEKEPKTKRLMTIIGILSLGCSYWMAVSIQSPIRALNMFFIAVLLVILGTYALFTAGSIALLKLLRKSKKIYYRTENFISISGMLYRMKQNAAGLASICILSTTVLVMLSTTVSLYMGLEDVLRQRYPSDISINMSEADENEVEKLNAILDLELKEKDIDIENMYNHWKNDFLSLKKDNKFILEFDRNEFNPADSASSLLVFIPISDYNRLEEKKISLENDELLIFSIKNQYTHDTITIDDKTYRVLENLDDTIFASKNQLEFLDTYILFVNDIDNIGNMATRQDKRYSIGFDIEGTENDIILLSKSLNAKIRENNINASIETLANNRQDFLETHGGLLFIGIFLGALFLMATVLIIYYKQISEGYDDKKRFEIMQKVGMSKFEIKKTIKSQVLLVFFLPLAFSVIHIAFAFPMITKLLAVLNLTNVPLFRLWTIVTILVFAVIYAYVYYITARVYYRIVK